MNSNTHMFKPAWWLTSPHLQTLWPTFMRRKLHALQLKRERIELSDGDFIDLDWTNSTSSQQPIVIVIHGLEGSIHSPYAQGILYAIQQQGWRGVLMHLRSCSGELNRLPRLYHSGDTADLADIVTLLKKREPTTLIAAVGFSIGGNILLKWLGETKNNNPLCTAVAVSVPFELGKAVNRLQQGFSQIYQRHLLNLLCKKAKRKFNIDISKIKTLRDFDNVITAPMHGFRDAEEYYMRSSSRQFLKDIQIPTLLLQAEDDPFMTKELLPKQHELSSYINMEMSSHGGHVGFITGGLPWRPTYWLDERIPDYLRFFL